jgi:hypothetical protein
LLGFKCFAHVTNASWESHVIAAVSAGYSPYESGGISHSDIPAVGSIAGLSVSEVDITSGLPWNNSTGKTPDGLDSVMNIKYTHPRGEGYRLDTVYVIDADS